MPDPSNVVPFPTPDAIPVPGDGMAYGAPGEGNTPTNLAVSIDTDDGKRVEVMDDGGIFVSDSDGSIGSPAIISYDDEDSAFGDNLAEDIPAATLAQIADEFLQGIEADIMSRTDLISQYNDGIDLLGLKIENISSANTQKDGISRVGHPLMLEAMIKYHPLALNTPIPTPDGWTTVGEVAVGDNVFDEFGRPARVVGLSDIETDKPCLKVTFDDGLSIIADEYHLWAVEEKTARTMKGLVWESRTLHTRDLIPLVHSIWLSKPLELPERGLPVDPYIFGVWLGDGDTGGDRITIGFADYEDTTANLSACGAAWHEVKGNGHSASVAVEGLWGALKNMGALGNKHIPVCYMRASRSQREALLQGLMDSDGHINKVTRQCCFSQVNFELIAQVQELLKTLAIKSSILCCPAATKTFPSGKTYTCQHFYQLRFTADCDRQIFRLPRKRKIQEAPHPAHARRTKMAKIVDVREVPAVPVRCLAVDSENHLFLAGLGMVPTHNSGAMAEMLPAAGPVKCATIGNVTSEEEQLAADFEADFNYFLTDIAKEFYPDTSRGLMHQGYAGQMYKKIYRDAMRQRPVSESVSMIDLIVSEEANDLDTAQRVTHQFFPSRSQVRRMQIVGRYADVNLGQPTSQLPAANRQIKQSEGLTPMGLRPQDLPYNFYECDSDIDVGFYDINLMFERKAPEGLPLPYKVTLDKDSRQVLGVWRNWKQDDELYRKRNMYVKYGFVPGLGYHDWGFLQILGNQTRALRAIWRLLIDAGMFSNFPGGVKSKMARMSTNEIRPGPGEFQDIELPAGVNDIHQVLMAFPYQKIDAMFIQFAEMVEQGAMRLGGTVNLEVGEGRTNVPVGTIMSMIEQQTQIMSAVHKGNHASQKDEFIKLRELFAENPEDLWRLARDPKRRWETASEFMDINLTPASDPNTPSQIHRIMKATALMQIVQANPQMYDLRAVNSRILATINEPSPEELLLSPEAVAANAAAQQPPGPAGAANDPTKLIALQQKGEQADKSHAAKMQEIQVSAAGKEKDRQLQAQSDALTSADHAADRAQQARTDALKEENARLSLQTKVAAMQAKSPPDMHTGEIPEMVEPTVNAVVPHGSGMGIGVPS
jgi:hypothetical protein